MLLFGIEGGYLPAYFEVQEVNLSETILKITA